MSPELKNFINNNLDLIDKDTKESWEKVYKKLENRFRLKGEFTKTILDAGITDPASIMGYIPKYYLSGSTIQNYKIPNSVTSIGEYAFYDCYDLTSIVIPNGVTSIDNDAFAWCCNLTSVVIGDSVETIDDYAFRNCHNLKKIKFKGAKKQAIQLGIGNQDRKKWRAASSIDKIICTDGEIIL